VWSPLVRLVHWSVAVLIVADMLNEAGANPVHRWLGYLAAALVLVRLAYGLATRTAARLSIVVSTASRAPAYATGRHRTRYLGHNPLGAVMALMLWTLILLVAVSGWMLQLDAFWGDDTVARVHQLLAYALSACAVLHVAGVATTSAMQRSNLVAAMVTGRKTLPEEARSQHAG
jgi:cytochrome b